MGQSVVSEGRGTVNMGSKVEADIGGSIGLGVVFSPTISFSVVFVSFVDALFVDVEGGKDGRIGGGSSMFSAAFRDSWRAKSDACHHSRNLSAKMEVGSRILRLLRSRG